MFATDRALLLIEPNLFRDAGVAGQRLLKGTCDISGTTLTLTAQDVDLAAANIGPGHVALVDGTPYEVLARLTSTTATISRPRASTADPAQPPSPATSKPVEVWTFAPQIAITHGMLLRMLGIEPSDPSSPRQVTEASITNPASLVTIEALGAICMVYNAATLSATPGQDGWASPIWARAQIFRERFAAARQLAVARIDTDGDGLPDATRRLNTLILTRA